MKWPTVVIAVVLLSVTPRAFGQAVPEGAGRVEELLGLTVDAEGVTFQVRSGGCTRPENFKIERFESGPVQLLVTRTVPDRCEAFFPYGTTFKVSYSHLRLAEGEEFVVLNPIATLQVRRLP